MRGNSVMVKQGLPNMYHQSRVLSNRGKKSAWHMKTCLSNSRQHHIEMPFVHFESLFLCQLTENQFLYTQTRCIFQQEPVSEFHKSAAQIIFNNYAQISNEKDDVVVRAWNLTNGLWTQTPVGSRPILLNILQTAWIPEVVAVVVKSVLIPTAEMDSIFNYELKTYPHWFPVNHTTAMLLNTWMSCYIEKILVNTWMYCSIEKILKRSKSCHEIFLKTKTSSN